KAVSASKVRASEDLPDRFFLVGHASAYCKVLPQTIAVAEQETTRTEWRLLKLSEIAAAFVQLRFDGNGDAQHTFQFTPTQTKVADYSGTSGGPVFGYKNGTTFDDYCVFAFQSKQILEASREQKAKYLIGTSGTAALRAVTNFLTDSTPGQSNRPSG